MHTGGGCQELFLSDSANYHREDAAHVVWMHLCRGIWNQFQLYLTGGLNETTHGNYQAI